MTPAELTEEIARLRALCRADTSGHVLVEGRRVLKSTAEARASALLGAYRTALAERPLYEDERDSLARLLGVAVPLVEALPRLLDEADYLSMRCTYLEKKEIDLEREIGTLRDHVRLRGDDHAHALGLALEALPEDIRISADGDLVGGIEGLEAAYRVERKAVEDHAREIARLRDALARSEETATRCARTLATTTAERDAARYEEERLTNEIASLNGALEMARGRICEGMSGSDVTRAVALALGLDPENGAVAVLPIESHLDRIRLAVRMAKAKTTVWNPPEEWHYTLGEHPTSENWSDAFDTREEAITDAREYHGPGVSFRVVRGASPDPARFVPRYRDTLEAMSEAAANDGPDDLDWPDPDDSAHAEYVDFMDAWARRHHPPSWWEATGESELIRGEEVADG